MITEELLNATSVPLLAEYEAGRTSWERALLSLPFLAIIFTAITGNLLVIVALTSSHTLWEQISNLFIVNLCVTDLSSAVVVMCTSCVALIADLRDLPSFWCNVVCAANYCFIIVSMVTLSCISVERLIAIYWPLHHPGVVTRWRVKLVCGYTWVQGAAFACAPIVLQWIHYDYWEVVCAIDWQLEKQMAVFYVIVAFVVNFGVPGLVMLGCYLAIIKEARRVRLLQVHATTQALPPSSTQSSTEDLSRNHAKRALKTVTSLLLIVLLFFIFMTPFCVTKLLKVIVEDPGYVPPYINLTASFFGYLSSMVNPFIYAIFRLEFRNAFKNTYKRLRLKLCPGSWTDHDMNLSSRGDSASNYSMNRVEPVNSTRSKINDNNLQVPNPAVGQ